MKKYLRVLALVASIAMIGTGVTSCGFDDEDEPETVDPEGGGETPDDPDAPSGETTVTLSQDVLEFGPEGGVAEVGIRSSIPVYLEGTVANDLDQTPSDMISENSFASDFYVDNGMPMRFETAIADSVLTVTVAPSQSCNERREYIDLFNEEGASVARLTVVQAPNPEIPVNLSSTGQTVVTGAVESLGEGMRTLWTIEADYIAGVEYIKPPLTAENSVLYEAFIAGYGALSRSAIPAATLSNAGMNSAAAFFDFMASVGYIEMCDKWDRIAFCPTDMNALSRQQQMPADSLLMHLTDELYYQLQYAPEGRYGCPTTPEEAMSVKSDVVKAALVEVLMRRGDYNGALDMANQIINSGWHSLSPSIGYTETDNSELIMGLSVNGSYNGASFVPVFTLSEVMLDKIECEIMTGNLAAAAADLGYLGSVKDPTYMPTPVTTPDELKAQLYDMRVKLGTPRRLAFMRRNGIAGFEPWQYIWPIPAAQLDLASGWVQNPGYASR